MILVERTGDMFLKAQTLVYFDSIIFHPAAPNTQSNKRFLPAAVVGTEDSAGRHCTNSKNVF